MCGGRTTQTTTHACSWTRKDGSGSDTVAELTVAFNALPFGEHGQVPHLAVRAGIVRVLIFAFGILAVIRKKSWTPTQATGFSPLFVAAMTMSTFFGPIMTVIPGPTQAASGDG